MASPVATNTPVLPPLPLLGRQAPRDSRRPAPGVPGTVETDDPAQHQVDALPAEALAAYAELRVVLETAPLSARPYHRHNLSEAIQIVP